jgi:LuxR family transcriptional regulator, regulator of acetate metabolism
VALKSNSPSGAVDVSDAVARAIETLLPERLQRMKQFTGLPVVFGGASRTVAWRTDLVVSRAIGALGDSLRGLVIRPGLGLGGTVLSQRLPRWVSDYAGSTTITHDYDRVVAAEGMTSVLAVPLIVRGAVHGLLYGAVREQQPIGDRGVRDALVVAQQLQRDVERRLTPEQGQPGRPVTSALADLAALIEETDDRALRDRLFRIHRDLGGDRPPRRGCALSPREIDALRLVAIGASNVEIAAELGLSPQTVKAYMHSAMQKLATPNRTAAVHAARLAGLLD